MKVNDRVRHKITSSEATIVASELKLRVYILRYLSGETVIWNEVDLLKFWELI